METTKQETPPVKEKAPEEQIIILDTPPEEGTDKPTEKAENNGPPEGSQRWNEMYFKSKELDRIKPAVSALQEENKTIKEKLASIEKQSSDSQVKAKLDSLHSQMDSAAKEDDMATYHKLQTQVNQTILETSTSKPVVPVAPKAAATPPSGMNMDVEFFIRDNPWFEQDFAMRGAAQVKDAELLADPAWSEKPELERLREVAKQVKARFNYDPKRPKGGAIEGGGDPPEAAGGKREVYLNADQKRVAAGLMPNRPKEEAYRLYAQNME